MINKKVSTVAGSLIVISIAVALSVSFLVPNKRTAEIKNENNTVPEVTKSTVDIAIKNAPANDVTEVKPDIAQNESTDISKPFHYSKGADYFGTLTLTGYLDIKNRVCEEDSMCNKTVDYASLIITSTNNNLIYDFISSHKGNSYVGENSIGIGCYEKDNKRIYSSNVGDDGNFENIITGSDLKKLLRSNPSKLVTIQLSKPYFTGGGGAPECYSHFRLFKILKK